ncbi:MAG: type II toxin-antitoxin system ParD family antitoxin [Xenococcaceae cyanobacterium MO_167.B27]|nr:type II toxin-antitoxin system ParD family antitoxin [Xenococcaceae cyanobacterium MO_167.B27]
MEIILQPELEQFIQEKITSGQYQSVNEAVNAGLKLLMERELIYQGRFAELRQEIMVGIEASERGEVVDSETVFNSIQQKLEQEIINRRGKL